MSKTTYEISLSVSFSCANKTEEIDLEELGYSEEEWISISEDERQRVLNDYITEWSYNYVEIGYKRL
jgi:hypothetical protein